jgi:hypothetical protein
MFPTPAPRGVSSRTRSEISFRFEHVSLVIPGWKINSSNARMSFIAPVLPADKGLRRSAGHVDYYSHGYLKIIQGA